MKLRGRNKEVEIPSLSQFDESLPIIQQVPTGKNIC